MLNLAEIKEEYFEVQLTEEHGILHLRKPSTALYDALKTVSSKLNTLTDKQELDETINLANRILNRNIEGIEFKKSDLTYSQADTLVGSYMTWIADILRSNVKN